MQIQVTDLEIEELSIYRALNENQLRRYYEPDTGIFICESAKVIRRALEAGYEPLSILTSIHDPSRTGAVCNSADDPADNSSANFDEIDPLVDAISDNTSDDVRYVFERCRDIPIYMAEEITLKALAGFSLTGGMLCAMHRKPLPSPQDILKSKDRIAVLEDVENPTNVGAIFRSAAALGMKAILLTHGCADPLYRRAARVSMGTVFQIPWTFIPKDSDSVKLLQSEGYTTVAMALSDDARSVSDPKIKSAEKLAVFLGNEGYGLKPETITESDIVAKIPMKEGIDSLNVAAASAVVFWEISKKTS